jgi:hypothetical protein
MPRARSQAEYILEQLSTVRQNIDKLNEKVKQVSFSVESLIFDPAN